VLLVIERKLRSGQPIEAVQHLGEHAPGEAAVFLRCELEESAQAGLPEMMGTRPPQK
jgi:hypothetical protein